MIFGKFRSKERDIETDVSRLLPIRSAVDASLRAAEKELEGLTGRLNEASEQAAFLFGSELVANKDISASESVKLYKAEQDLTRGLTRSSRLRHQLRVLREIASKLDTISPAESPLPK